MARDPYDPMVAFDDLYGGQSYTVGASYGGQRYTVGAAHAMAARAARRRMRSPNLEIVGAGYDPTYKTFQVADVTYQLIGADEPTGLPLFDRIKQRFHSAIPSPKVARVDDADSYHEFRHRRVEAKVAEIESRLRQLETAYAVHAADQHGGGRVAALEAALDKHIAEAVHGEQTVSLPIAAMRDGRLGCWVDGDEVLCTAVVRGVDGRPRFVTSGEHLGKHMQEAVVCGMQVGADPEDIVECAPSVAHVLGAVALIPQVLGVARELTACAGDSRSFVATLSCSSDPAVAATMALLQRAEQGDPRAIGELQVLSMRAPRLVRQAKRCLAKARIASRRMV